MGDIELKEKGKCAMCDNGYTWFGNNPEPVLRYWQRVCDRCNLKVVVPARLRCILGRPQINQHRLH